MRKYYGIEILRLLTSLSVLLYHYRHFFGPSNITSEINYEVTKSSLPFYQFLESFYNHGLFGVHVFYTISGFVFAHVYLSASRKISFRDFFLNRFARLYPLHFATLIVVLILQIINFRTINSFQIYFINDLYHFLLNIFFISSWGLEKGYSFNGPIWSISIEIIIYFLFFILLSLLRKYRLILVILISIIFIMIYKIFDLELLTLTCARLFFSGVLIYLISEKWKKNLLLQFIIFSTLLLFSFIGNFKIYLFCPSVLMIFVLIDNLIKRDGIKYFFKSAGNLTYALYLLHIPVQLIILIFAYHLNFTDTIYINHYFFLSFFVVMILLSNYSFQFFEKPLNQKIRKKFTK